MKILLINKFHYLSGGSERYLFEWQRILRAHGHRTAVFSMQHPLNRPSEQERFFVNQIRFATDLPLREKARAALHSVWSAEARRNIEALLRAEGRPDIVHLHSYIYQLTSSTLAPLLDRGIPVVQTCHDYGRVCVNQHFHHPRTQRICEECLRTGRLAPLRTSCIKGSWLASATGCAAGLVDDLLVRGRDRIRRFLTPSEFMRRKLIEGGLRANRVFHVPNFIDPDIFPPADALGDYILFLGRLAPQKGLFTLLDAAAQTPDIPFKIVGRGELEAQAAGCVRTRNLRNVELLGHREGEELTALVRHCRALVVPSEWYEVFPLVILEAMAAARPVIAAKIGGLGEVVAGGRNGLLFPPGNSAALAEAVRTLWGDPQRARSMGEAGLEVVRTAYTGEAHYVKVMRHFREVLQ